MHARPAALALAVPLLLATVLTAAGAADPAPAAAAFPAKDSRYHDYAEMVATIQAAQTAHPDIVKVQSIGKSYQGRDIWAVKVSDNVATDETEPEVLFDGLHHAREHLSAEQALAHPAWLTDGYGTNAAITRLVDHARDLDRPDGQPRRRRVRPHRRRLPRWRKNRQPNSGTTAVGTDLNRNYGYHWACCGGSSASKSSATVPRLGGVLDARGPGHPRLHGQPPGRRPPADQGRDHVPHGRRADPVAVRLHPAPTSRPT